MTVDFEDAPPLPLLPAVSLPPSLGPYANDMDIDGIIELEPGMNDDIYL